jgi:rRNA maturation endonuclease Nob1
MIHFSKPIRGNYAVLCGGCGRRFVMPGNAQGYIFCKECGAFIYHHFYSEEDQDFVFRNPGKDEDIKNKEPKLYF